MKIKPRSMRNPFLNNNQAPSACIQALAEVSCGQRGPWPPLTLQNFHYLNSDLTLFISLVASLTKAGPPCFFGQAPPLSIVAGEERAESPVAERECRTGVSQNAGRKRANCDAIGCMRCRAPFIGPHAAACAGAQLPMLLPATVEFYFAGEPAESLPLL